ncbi:tetratricopeptide repeat protein [Vicingus serpentipes]|uniref:tetratricopeptide repeat protein n=1 Tax=Vicingus serpentipes TaxID=1926625 RepID=UPI00147701E9|nr:tetratricopeptide repeat protein [Vicingus serpentipes]
MKSNNKLDSLYDIVYNKNSHDTSLAGAWLSLSEILYVSNLDTIIPLCENSKLIAEKALLKNNSSKVKKSLLKSLAGSINNIGYVYSKHGEISIALEYYNQSLQLLVEAGDQKGIASALNNMAAIYEDQGDILKALEFYHLSLRKREKLNDKKGKATSLNNIGMIYINQDNINQALDYYQKSIEIYTEINDLKGQAHALNNIGTAYEKKGDIDQALSYYSKSLKIKEELEHQAGISISLTNIGRIYLRKEDTISSLKYNMKSLEISNKIGNSKGLVTSLTNISKIYLSQGKLNIAKEYALKAFKIAKEIGQPDKLKTAAEICSDIYKKQGEGMKALDMFKLHIQMRDSINNKENQKVTIQQQAKYEYEKQKTIDDAFNEKQLEVEKEAKAKQQVITYATGCLLGLVAIFSIFVMNRLKVTRKQKKVIEQQKEVVEMAHQEIKDSITYAKRIQNAILPSSKLVKEYLQESFIFYKPKDVVAGDFYWMEHKNNKILFAAADCTGHGVPGAMVSVVCNNGLNRAVREYGLTDPGEILDKARDIVIQEFEKSEEDVKDGMDIALCSLEGNKLQYAGAHNPLWIIRNGEIIETKANKQPIGKFDNPEPYTTHSFDLQQGDSLYIFSDGYIDQFGGEKGKKFKVKAFRDLLLSIQDKTMEEQKTIIDEAFETWRGSLAQIDDVCVIGVKI